MKSIKILGIILLLILSYFLVKKPIRIAYYDYMYEKAKKNTIKWEKGFDLKSSDFILSDTDYTFARVGITNRYEFTYDLNINYKSETLFYPLNSYISDSSDMRNLELQQCKFDLCEIYRRKLERKIMNLKFTEFPKSRKDSVNMNTEIYYDLFEKEWERINNLPEDERLIELQLVKEKIKK